MMYTLNAADEKVLDRYEGVPSAYKKELIPVEYLGSHDYGQEQDGLRIVEALVYVDDIRKDPGAPKTEYINRMNLAIKDALQEGTPEEYIIKYLREYIPDK